MIENRFNRSNVQLTRVWELLTRCWNAWHWESHCVITAGGERVKKGRHEKLKTKTKQGLSESVTAFSWGPTYEKGKTLRFNGHTWCLTARLLKVLISTQLIFITHIRQGVKAEWGRTAASLDKRNKGILCIDARERKLCLFFFIPGIFCWRWKMTGNLHESVICLFWALHW
jgi:hypothetical protein